MVIEVRPGVRLAVHDDGSGPAVVFLHGLAGCKELWNDAAGDVRRAGFRVITYDQRGHGASADTPAPWTIQDLSDDLAGLLDHFEVDRACLIGHSMGGRALFQFALDRPHRLWAVVPVAAQSEAPRSPYRESLAATREAAQRGGLAAFREAFAALGEIPMRVADDPAFATDFEASFSRNRPQALIAALDAILAMPVLTPRLSEITVPALTVVGESDEPFRHLADHYERVMPNCRTVVIPGCHHYPMTDQPRAFAAVLTAFLAEVRPDA